MPEQFEGDPPLLAVAVEGCGMLIDAHDQTDAVLVGLLRMNALQREIFEETAVADQASLEVQLAALQASTPSGAPGGGASQDKQRRQPKREALPAHLARVEQRVEPEDTHCPTPECGQPMVRVARTSASGWTSFRRSSSCSGKYGASGRAGAAS